MVNLTEEDRDHALTLLKHPVVFKLLAQIEQDILDEVVMMTPTETARINAALGEVRAARNLRNSLGLIGFEHERMKAAR